MKTFLLILALVFICSCHVVAIGPPVLVVPETWKSGKITGKIEETNITGDFELLGESAPESPKIFMERFPFSFDTMVGTDIPNNKKKGITHVHIDQNNCSSLTLSYFAHDRPIITRQFGNSDTLRISCNNPVLNISEKPPEACSEGGCRAMKIETRLHVAADGSLILSSVYEGVDSFFYFIKRPFREEYLVKFKRVEQNFR